MWFTENANPGVLARISLPPLVRSRDVQYLSDNSAQLPAKIRPNAQATEFHFEYGRNENRTKKSAYASAGAGWDHVEVDDPRGQSAAVDDLPLPRRCDERLRHQHRPQPRVHHRTP